MKEQPILKRIMLACSRGRTRLFRQNAGAGWAGSSVVRASRTITVTLNPGDVVVRDAQPLRAGFPGMSDLIGWTSRIVTPDMVGKQVAIYCSVEVKSASGRVRPVQQVWLDLVRSCGGIAGVARSAEEAQELISEC